MKKNWLIFVLLILPALLYAVDVDLLISEAEKTSPLAESYRIQKENTDILLEKTNLSSGLGVSASLNNVTVDKNGLTMPSFTVGLSLGDASDWGKITGSISNSTITGSLRANDEYVTSLGAEKTFSLNKSKTSKEKIDDRVNELQSELNYKSNMIQFDTAVIKAVKQILEAKKSLEKTELTYQRTKEDYESDLLTNTVDRGSLVDRQRQMELSVTEAGLIALRNSLNTAIDSFKQQFGIDYKEVDYVREANLSFNENAEGNTKLLLDELKLESSELALKEAKSEESTIGVGANYGTNLVKENNHHKLGNDDSLTANASLKLGDLTLKVSSNNLLDSSKSMTVSGSWNKTTALSKISRLDIQNLENALITAQNSYDNSLFSYKSDLATLKNDIEKHINDLKQMEIKVNYYKDTLSYTEELYEMGMVTMRTLEDARAGYENILTDKLILLLDGLVLENRIKTIEL